MSSARRKFGEITEAKLERWLGGDVVDSLHLAATGCYVPIPIAGIPLVAYRGALVPNYEPLFGDSDRVQGLPGFASLSDLIAEATTGGKSQVMPFSQVGVAGIVNVPNFTWAVGPIPTAGANAAAPAGGTVPTRATTGALGQLDPGGGDTLHMTTFTALSTQIGSIMLFDKLFATTTAANPGVGSIAVTGLQTRYTGAAGTPEYPAGSVIANRVAVVFPVTAHNITYTYIDQDNNAGASSGAIVGRVSAGAQSSKFPLTTWAAPLAGGDQGVRQITAIQYSASPATGQDEHQIIRPIAIIPVPIVGVPIILDGINSAFNLVKVMPGACLTFMEFFKTATAAATMSGTVQLVSG